MQTLGLAHGNRLVIDFITAQVHVGRIDGLTGRNQPGGNAALHHILGHRPVRGPFAARDRDQPAAADQYRVLPAQALGGGTVIVLRLDQRAQAHPDAAHIGPRGGFAQVTARLF